MKAAALVSIVIALAGCATYRVAPLSPARSAAGFESRRLDSPEVTEFLRNRPHPRRGGLPSWDLTRLTDAAYFFQPDLAVARAQRAGAQAAEITAGARPNPTLGFSPQITTNMLGGMSPWTLGFNLDVPIETAGKRGYRLVRAQQLSQAAALNIANVAWQVRSRVRKNLLELYSASEREQLLVRQQNSQEQTVNAFEQRIAAGEIGRPEVIQSRLLFNQTRLLLCDAQKQKAQARVGVADAVGVPVSALDGIALSFDDFARLPNAVAEKELRRRTLFSRPDVLGALADYAAADAALRLEIANQYPDVHLNPGYMFDQGQNKWSVGLSLTLPILNQNRGPIAEAEAKRTELAAKFESVQARAIGELDRALAGYRGALKKLQTADELLAAQQKQHQSSESLFKAGETDHLTLLSAQVELDAIAVSRLDALVEAQQALGQLEDATQTSLDHK